MREGKGVGPGVNKEREKEGGNQIERARDRVNEKGRQRQRE